MTTPNGQHDHEPNGATQQATSTVLALDGWGPMLAEPQTNGANGSEPAVAAQEPTLQLNGSSHGSPRRDWRASVQSGWDRGFAQARIDPTLIRLIAPLAAMTIAVIAALKLGDAYLEHRAPEPTPAPPSRMSTLRRSIALVIDPSLTPPQPQRPVWERWMRQTLR